MESEKKLIDNFASELVKSVESLAKKYGATKPQVHLGDQNLITLKSELNLQDKESEPIELLILFANDISDKIEREIGMGFSIDIDDGETVYDSLDEV